MNLFQLGHCLFRTDHPIAATVEGPGAAEGAIPGTAPRKLDRGAGVQDSDEILAPVPDQISCRTYIVEALDELWRRAFPVEGHNPWNVGDRLAVVLQGQQQLG